MLSKKRERFKTVLLTVLITASILQAGILWNYQSHGSAIWLFGNSDSGTPSSAEEYDELARETFFKPFRIIAYSGMAKEQAAWPLSKYDQSWGALWEEAKQYLLTAMKSKKAEKLDRSEWFKLIQNEAFVFEMASGLPADIIRYFLGISPEADNEIETVHKIMLSLGTADADVTVYILGENLYKLGTMPAPAEGLTGSDYAAILARLSDSADAMSYRLFGLTAGLVEGVEPDVLANLTEDRKLFELYNQSIPQKKLSDVEMMRGLLLERQRDSFDVSQTGGMITFQTLDHQYKVDTVNGLIEYRYNPGTGSVGAGSVRDAFRAVFKRFNGIVGELLPHSDFFLYSVESGGTAETPSYKFNFCSWAGEHPVFSRDKYGVSFPLTMTANSAGVLSFTWAVREITEINYNDAYDINFLNLVQRLAEKYGFGDSELRITDAIECYVPMAAVDLSKLESGWTGDAGGSGDSSDAGVSGVTGTSDAVASDTKSAQLLPALAVSTGDELLYIDMLESED